MGESGNQSGQFGLTAVHAQGSRESSSPRIRPVFSLLAYVGVVFIGGALLAPWLYRVVSQVAPSSQLAAKPFHRYLDRSLLGIALIGIWPLLWNLDVRTPWSLFRAGTPGVLRRLTRGLMLGFASLACVTAIDLALHARQLALNGHGGQIMGKLVGAAGTAVVVAVLEEFLFRGAIFGAMRRVWNWRIALLVSSVIYAVVHFLAKTELSGPVTWHSGLDLLPQMFSPLANRQEAIPALLSLTVGGLILGLAYQRTGDLYFSMGLHAGWVFWLKAYGLVTSRAPGATLTLSSMAGTEKLLDGWIAFAVLLGVLLILPRIAPNERKGNPW